MEHLASTSCRFSSGRIIMEELKVREQPVLQHNSFNLAIFLSPKLSFFQLIILQSNDDSLKISYSQIIAR